MILYYVNFCSIPFYYGIIFLQQPYHIILFVICHVDIDIKYTHEHLYIWCSPFAVWYIKVFASRQVVRDPGKALKKLTPIEHLMTGGAAGGIDSWTIHGTGLTMNILFGCHGRLKDSKYISFDILDNIPFCKENQVWSSSTYFKGFMLVLWRASLKPYHVESPWFTMLMAEITSWYGEYL